MRAHTFGTLSSCHQCCLESNPVDVRKTHTPGLCASRIQIDPAYFPHIEHKGRMAHECLRPGNEFTILPTVCGFQVQQNLPNVPIRSCTVQCEAKAQNSTAFGAGSADRIPFYIHICTSQKRAERPAARSMGSGAQSSFILEHYVRCMQRRDVPAWSGSVPFPPRVQHTQENP